MKKLIILILVFSSIASYSQICPPSWDVHGIKEKPFCPVGMPYKQSTIDYMIENQPLLVYSHNNNHTDCICFNDQKEYEKKQFPFLTFIYKSDNILKP